MIKKIVKLKEFGSFKDFTSPANLNDFSNYNLFFGLNGSGKTTLSRFLSFINMGQISSDFIAEEFNENFNLLLNDNSTITSLSNNLLKGKIKVFNKDFIDKNLSLDSVSAETKTINYNIGEESTEIKKKIEDITKSIDKRFAENTQELVISNKRVNIESKIDTKYKNIAELIRDDLKIQNSSQYRKDHYAADFARLHTNATTITVDEKNNYSEIHSQEVKEMIPVLNDYLNLVSEEYYTKVQTLLSTVITRKGTLREDVINWLEEGLKYKETTACPFCNQDIINWEDRLSQIKCILVKDDKYESFEAEIIESLNRTKELINRLGRTPFQNLRKLDFLSTIQINEIDIVEAKDLNEKCIDFLEELKKKLEQKYKTKDIELKLEYYDIWKRYNTKLSQINNFIVTHNDEIEKLEENKKNAKIIIISYYVQENKEEILQLKETQKLFCRYEVKLKQKINKLKNDIIKLETQLGNQKLPLEKIQRYISIIFGEERFVFEFNLETNAYKIKRKDEKLARNLSEGEKTSIAFSYFLATLLDKDFNLKNGIVVIDDPISSLDQKYLFNLINLLYNNFSSTKKFKQLFILTHNFYFFRKIRNILQNKQKSIQEQEKQKQREACIVEEIPNILSIYEIIQNSVVESSIIKNATKYLLNYESEYIHLIEYLRDLQKSEEEILNLQVGIGIRRTLEIFLSFKYPKATSFFTKYKNAISSIGEEDRHKYNYLEDIANACGHTDECADLSVLEEYKLIVGKNEINQLFNFINAIDNKHYAQLPKEH